MINCKKLLYSLSLVFFFGFQNAHAQISDCYSRALSSSITVQKRIEKYPVFNQANEKGIFTVSTPEHIQSISNLYRAGNQNVNIALENISKFTQRNINIDLGVLRKNDNNLFIKLRKKGLKLLKGSKPETKLAQEELSLIKKLGFKRFSTLSILTSGAGLWSRGGGQVKALIPLNLKNLISEEDFNLLTHAGRIVSAKSNEDVLKKSGVEIINMKPDEIIKKAQAYSDEAKNNIEKIIRKAKNNKNALNILDLKFAEIASLSQESQSYIHFDIWTSEQTHLEIKKYLSEFRTSYRDKTFHSDKKIDQKIKENISRYIEASHLLGETHLFGYQKGVYALNPHSGAHLSDSVHIGEGAGMAKHYMDETDRTTLLLERKVQNWVFQNIEVAGDLSREYAAFIQSEKQVGVVIVPTQPGYSGGSPYLVKTADGFKSMLLEESAVPQEIAKGNDYFNTNTIYQSLRLKGPKNVGFESKENGRIVRAKMNAGDITMEHESSMIAGEIKLNYENFKNYEEYGENGPEQILVIQNRLAEIY